MSVASHRSRRRFLLELSAVAGSLASVSWPRVLSAQPAVPSTVRLSERMIAVLSADANVVAADSTAGVVLVDGGHASWSGALLRTVDTELRSRPVRALFNTHWHPEQTGSNQVLGERGVEIVAHENTQLWLGTEVWVRWSDEKYPPLPKAAQPSTTFYESGSRRFGDRAVEYTYLPKAHTDGDIAVFFPHENVLVTGGMVSNDAWPIIDWWTGGWIAGMLDGFDSLLAIANEETRIVPGSGPLMSLADLEAQEQMHLAIFDRLQAMLRKGLELDEALAAKPTAEFDARYGDPTQFVTLAWQSMGRHLRDLYDTRLRNIA